MIRFARTIFILAAIATMMSGALVARASEDESSASEVLAGNGTRAGYVLGHGGVITGSEWVVIGAKSAARNRDYTIDYAAGSIFFTEPVRQMDSIRIDYRYSKKASQDRSVASGMGMAMSFGNTMQMNFMYSYAAADQSKTSSDVATYGANITTKLSGTSSIKSMMFMATPQASNRLSLTSGAPAASGATKAKEDRLMVQDADLGLGKLKLNLDFQDVGQDFAGFSAMRSSKVAADDVINQLEKEKGIQRMGMTGSMQLAGESAFNFSLNKIEDANDEIMSRAFAYTGASMKFSYATREVGAQFSRFSDLKEADRAQMAAEAGMTRSNIGLQVKTGMTMDKANWSALGMTDLSGPTGSLSYRTADLNLGMVTVQADVRTMDPTFDRMAALNDVERSRMALTARRQFDPGVQATAITAADKNQINSEAGLDRSTYILTLDGGPIDTWMSLSNIDSTKGGLTRRSFNISTQAFSVYFNTHSIDKSFTRLGNLQPVERTRFGNEYGMTRNEFGGKTKLMGGEFSLSNAVISDELGSNVTRRVFNYKNSRLNFKANLLDIDPDFSRFTDLSDSDKASLAQERGFSRRDYSVNYALTRSLSLDTYFYDATSPSAGQAKSQTRYKIDFTPQIGPKIGAFYDDYSYISEGGVLSSYSRRRITFDNKMNLLGGLAISALSDTNTVQDGSVDPATTATMQTHMETNQKANTSFALDTLNIDYGNGKVQDTRSLKSKTKIGQKMALVGTMGSTTRENGESQPYGNFGLDMAVSKDLKLTWNLTNEQTGQRLRNFSLNGILAKRLLLLSDVKIGSAMNTCALNGKQTGCDNALKLEAGLLGGKLLFDNSDKLNAKNGIYYTSRIFRYESDRDAKRWYHLTFFNQNLVTPNGTPAQKQNYALDMKLNPRTSLTLSSYVGKDGQNGAVLAIDGTVFKITHNLAGGVTWMADYCRDMNDVNHRNARVFGMGFSRPLSNNGAMEIYVGMCDLEVDLNSDSKMIYRVKYDHKMSAENYISITAQRKTGVEVGSINEYEGDTIARIEFRRVFD